MAFPTPRSLLFHPHSSWPLTSGFPPECHQLASQCSSQQSSNLLQPPAESQVVSSPMPAVCESHLSNLYSYFLSSLYPQALQLLSSPNPPVQPSSDTLTFTFQGTHSSWVHLCLLSLSHHHLPCFPQLQGQAVWLSFHHLGLGPAVWWHQFLHLPRRFCLSSCRPPPPVQPWQDHPWPATCGELPLTHPPNASLLTH